MKKILISLILVSMLIGVVSAAATYTSQYPPAQTAVYVNSTSKASTSYWAYYATDPAKTLTGSPSSNSWESVSGSYTNQRFHIDLGSSKTIGRIYYENFHNSGSNTNYGIRNFTFYGTNDAVAFLNVTYAADANWTQIDTDVTSMDQHVASNTADPKYVITAGNTSYRYYAIKAASAWGSTTLMGVRRIELQSENAMTANFTVTPEPSFVNRNATFTDTTNGLVTTWNWTFGDGNTSTLASPVHAYPSVGTYTVSMNVTNSTGIYSNVTLYHTVTNVTGVTRQDLYQAGIYNQTFHITSSTTGLPIPVVSIYDENGQRYNTTTGTGYLYESLGIVVVYFSADGYTPKAVSYAVDSDASHDVQLTPFTPQTITGVYVPQQTRFKFIDFNLKPLDNLYVSAAPVNFTAPSNWTEILIGINPGVDITGTTVSGFTGTDGSIVFPVLASNMYNMSISGTTADGRVVNHFTFAIYPLETYYQMTIPTTTNPGPVMTEAPQNAITTSLYNRSFNATAEWYNATYYDPTGGTDSITFFMANSFGNITYSSTVTGVGANDATFSNVTINPNGGTVTCGFIANQSVIGNVSRVLNNHFTNYVSLNGGAPGYPELWIALGLIVLVAAFFSYMSVPIGALITIGLTAYMTWGIGWINPHYGSSSFATGLMVVGTLAAIKYIRSKEDRLS